MILVHCAGIIQVKYEISEAVRATLLIPEDLFHEGGSYKPKGSTTEIWELIWKTVHPTWVLETYSSSETYPKTYSRFRHLFLNRHLSSIKMFEFLLDIIFVVLTGKLFQHIVNIPMGINGTPLLADIFLHLYEAEFIQSLLSTERKQLASRFNFT